jgi:hypothetical protein
MKDIAMASMALVCSKSDFNGEGIGSRSVGSNEHDGRLTIIHRDGNAHQDGRQ